MADAELARAAGGGVPIQAFPLTTGANCNKTTAGTATGIHLIRCIADGTVAVTFADTTTADVAMVAGDDYAFPDGANIVITSGTYMVA